MRTFAAIALCLAAAACTDAHSLVGTSGEVSPMGDGAALAADELELHRANVEASATLSELHAEIDRHKAAAEPMYYMLRVRLGGLSTCASKTALAQMQAWMRGIEATELGRDDALVGMQKMGQARYTAGFYADGVSGLLDKIVTLSSEQRGCY